MTQVNDLLKERDKSKKRKSEDSDHHQHHKHKNKKKDKEDSKESTTTKSPAASQSKTIEQMRAERLKRESEERIKAQRLLLGIKDPASNAPKVEVDDRKRRYNNQFNPEMSKY